MMLVLEPKTCDSAKTLGLSYRCAALQGGEEGEMLWFERGN